METQNNNNPENWSQTSRRFYNFCTEFIIKDIFLSLNYDKIPNENTYEANKDRNTWKIIVECFSKNFEADNPRFLPEFFKEEIQKSIEIAIKKREQENKLKPKPNKIFPDVEGYHPHNQPT
jgi:hypothetical protein